MRRLLVIAVILAVLVAVPPFLGLGFQNALINVLIAGLFALAFNLLSGQTGLLSFGHAAYFGVGAFATIHLMLAVEDGFNFPTVLLPLAGAIAGLGIGAIFGFFATMRSGVYFALVTLAIAELFHSLAPHWQEVFGGEAGLSSMRLPWQGFSFGSVLEIYYLALAWAVVSVWLLWAYTRTPFGRLTLAMRENEQRVRFLGYNTHAAKIIVFAVSAAFAGIAGSLQAISIETANYSVFSSHVSAQVVLHTFVGGSTIFFGPVVGAVVFTLFAYLFSDLTRSWLFYQGLIFVLVMLYAPIGLGGVIQHHVRNWQRLDWSRLAVPYAIASLGGMLIAGSVVYLIETLSILFDEPYALARKNSDLDFPPYEVFGASWLPTHPFTWLLPLALFGAGLFLLLRVRRDITKVWDAIHSTASDQTTDNETHETEKPSGDTK